MTAERPGRPVVLTERDRSVVLTERDLQMLSFMGEHRVVLERQVADLLGLPEARVQSRLRRLGKAGYVSRFCVFERDQCCQIRGRGLAAIDSSFRPPQENLGEYRHDIGVAWLWLAARRGEFGAAEVIGERRLRSHDKTAPDDPYAIRLGGYHENGSERRHYPDLLLIDPHGRRLALELELTPKSLHRRESILAGYGADRRVDEVIYFVESHRQGRSIGRALQASVSRMGLSDRIRLRFVTPIEPGRGGSLPSREGIRSAKAILSAEAGP